MTHYECRMCGACCIELSISSPYAGYPEGKSAGERCIHLQDDFTCSIYESRPLVCRDWQPSELCGHDGGQARKNLRKLEEETSP